MSTFAFMLAARAAPRIARSPAAKEALRRLAANDILRRRPLPFVLPLFPDWEINQQGVYTPALPPRIYVPSSGGFTQINCGITAPTIGWAGNAAFFSCPHPAFLNGFPISNFNVMGGDPSGSWFGTFWQTIPDGVGTVRLWPKTAYLSVTPIADQAAVPQFLPAQQEGYWVRNFISDVPAPDIRMLVPSAPPTGDFPTPIPLRYVSDLRRRNLFLPPQVDSVHWYPDPPVQPKHLPSYSIPAVVRVLTPDGQVKLDLNGSHNLLPPRNNEKESKGRPVSRAVYKLYNFLLGNITESLDFVNAIYNTLPNEIKPRHKTAAGKTTNFRRIFVSPEDKMAVIYHNAHRMDGDAVFKAVLSMQIKDALIGKFSKQGAETLRGLIHALPDTYGVRTVKSSDMMKKNLIENIEMGYQRYDDKKAARRKAYEVRRLERNIKKLDRRFGGVHNITPEAEFSDLIHKE